MSSAPPATGAGPKPIWRGWLHQGGAVGLALASPILLVRAHNGAQVAWVLCYLVGVEAMMVISALLHRVNWTPARRRAWRRADQVGIFAAIVGTFVALGGLTMHGNIRLVLLVLIVVGSLAGIGVRQLALDAPKWANTLPFLVISWAAIFVMPQIYRGGGPLCFALVIGGGLAYTLGAVAYAARRPRLNPRVFGYHELFHAGTILGAGLHFAALAVALH